MLSYARVLIEFPIEGPFPDYTEFCNESDFLIRESLSYEWLPIKCSHCGMFGHNEPIYRKKGLVRREWTPVQHKPESTKSTEASHKVTPGADGFILDTRKSKSPTRHPQQSVSDQRALFISGSPLTSSNNQFQALENSSQGLVQSGQTYDPIPHG